MVRKQLKPRQVAVWAGLAVFIIGVLTFYLWHLNENIRIGWETAKLEKELKAAQVRVEQLKAERAKLLAPDRVERIARSELKLGEPRDDQIIYEDR